MLVLWSLQPVSPPPSVPSRLCVVSLRKGEGACAHSLARMLVVGVVMGRGEVAARATSLAVEVAGINGVFGGEGGAAVRRARRSRRRRRAGR